MPIKEIIKVTGLKKEEIEKIIKKNTQFFKNYEGGFNMKIYNSMTGKNRRIYITGF